MIEQMCKLGFNFKRRDAILEPNEPLRPIHFWALSEQQSLPCPADQKGCHKSLRYVMACGLQAMSFDSRYNNNNNPGTRCCGGLQGICKVTETRAVVVQLDRGGKGYWFGSTRAKKIVLFFPGMLRPTLTERPISVQNAVSY
jgi:hypothetical protein